MLKRQILFMQMRISRFKGNEETNQQPYIPTITKEIFFTLITDI